VIRRLYIHNFRCLSNFSLLPNGESSVLLIGENGSGKTSVRRALEILQKIALGTNRVKELLKPEDVWRGNLEAPLRIELEVAIDSKAFAYSLAFELPPGFREMRILDEKLVVDGAALFTRQRAQVTLARLPGESSFGVDWHLVALPIVQEQSQQDPLFIFRQWLSRMIILQPIPQQINGDSSDATLVPSVDALNFGDWFTGLLANTPSAYTTIADYLREAMPDLKDIKNPVAGPDSRSLQVQYSVDGISLQLPFRDLSDGEKCLFICAVVVAANAAYGPICCFWDEPESHIGISEVGHLVVSLRKAFGNGGQFIATSHNPEAIRKFSDDNTFLLLRKSHLEPTVLRKLSELKIDGDLVRALTRGDVGA
jgi:predicted ATPase